MQVVVYILCSRGATLSLWDSMYWRALLPDSSLSSQLHWLLSWNIAPGSWRATSGVCISVECSTEWTKVLFSKITACTGWHKACINTHKYRAMTPSARIYHGRSTNMYNEQDTVAFGSYLAHAENIICCMWDLHSPSWVSHAAPQAFDVSILLTYC